MKTKKKESLGELLDYLPRYFVQGPYTALALKDNRIVDEFDGSKMEAVKDRARERWFIGSGSNGAQNSMLILERGRPVYHCDFAECSWRVIWRSVS